MNKSFALFVFVFLSAFSFDIDTALAEINLTVNQCAARKGTCVADSLPFSSANCSGAQIEVGACEDPTLTPGGYHCCINKTDLTQYPKVLCESAGDYCSMRQCEEVGTWTTGVCSDVPGYYCCKRQPLADSPGNDDYCTSTLKGNCVLKTDTCGKTAVQVGTCEDQGSGERICCQTPIIAGPAVSPYNLLEKIPGSSNTVGNLNTYLEDIYRFAFWAVGIAVVFMLTIGGFMYLTSAGNTSRLGTAKTIIFDAFLGLILALVAWLFLNLINPNLVDLALPTTSVVTPPPPTDTGGTSSTLAGVLKTTPGVTVSSAGDCKLDATTPVSPDLSLQQSANGMPVTYCQKGCPSSGFCQGQTTLSTVMLGALIKTANVYQFEITSFTGGDHSGGSAHYSGRAVDIVPRGIPKSDWPLVQQYLRTTTTGGQPVICDIWDATLKKNISIKCDDPRADHIHAQW